MSRNLDRGFMETGKPSKNGTRFGGHPKVYSARKPPTSPLLHNAGSMAIMNGTEGQENRPPTPGSL